MSGGAARLVVRKIDAEDARIFEVGSAVAGAPVLRPPTVTLVGYGWELVITGWLGEVPAIGDRFDVGVSSVTVGTVAAS